MIPLSKKPKIIEKKENWARFEVEALYPGYGVTIGNSLRRVLLSSLEGAAATQMKIKNVPHELSTIPGVLEDVILIIQNLKEMRFKMFSDKPQKATLKIKGVKKVKGSDFKLPSQLELVNKNCHIATLTKKNAKLEMEIQIERGIGYVPKEARKKQSLEIGTILLDSIFTPVRRVSFKVENMRVGERTDFDRLFLDIKTDGTITPEEALQQASDVLVKHFSLFAETFKVDIKIEDLKLSQRTQNALLENNINTVSRLLRRKNSEILSLKGIGPKGVKEIKKALKKFNLTLSNNEEKKKRKKIRS
jgi:DNA-directed RNA polymerase subunit alpha